MIILYYCTYYLIECYGKMSFSTLSAIESLTFCVALVQYSDKYLNVKSSDYQDKHAKYE